LKICPRKLDLVGGRIMTCNKNSVKIPLQKWDHGGHFLSKKKKIKKSFKISKGGPQGSPAHRYVHLDIYFCIQFFGLMETNFQGHYQKVKLLEGKTGHR
jgi:hypothetical protein